MTGDDVLTLLDGLIAHRVSVDETESISRKRFRGEVPALAKPCEEDADPTHVTASAIVLGPRGVLLHRHKRLGIWLQPGGHIDRDEHPADAAVRETLEETGIIAAHFSGSPQLFHVDVHPGPRGHTHLDLRYLLTAGDVDPDPPTGESPEVRWWPFEEAVDLDVPGLSGILRALTICTQRSASPADAPTVAELYLRSFGLAYRNTPVALARPPSDVRRWVRDQLLPGHVVTVVEAAGVVVGYAAESPGWLSHLYIDPVWAGRGLGTSLLETVKEHQPGGFDLWTFEVNRRARTFYESHGLVTVELGDGSTNEEGQPDVRCRWA